MKTKSLVLETIDSATGCIVENVEFNNAEVSILLALLEMEDVDFFGVSYDLDAMDISKIRDAFEWKSLNEAINAARLRARGAWDALPYKIHTGRELLMMLAGEKPLAAFCEIYPPMMNYELIPESHFDSYVADGLFLKREYVCLEKNNSKTRVVLYARKGEEWRIEAYILLKHTADKFGWNEGFERMEGSLLGYEAWQNDIHIKTMFNGGAK